MQTLVKRYSSADVEQKFETREATLDREISRQLDKATKIEQLIETAREQLPELAERIEHAVRGASRVSPASSARNSNPNSTRNPATPSKNSNSNSNSHLYKLADDVNGMSLSPKGSSNSARGSKPSTPNGARSHRSNA